MHGCLKRTLLFSNLTIVPAKIKRAFQHVAALNELWCLTSSLENFSLIEPRSEPSLVGQWAGRLSPRHNEEATKMLSQIPLEVLGPQRFAAAGGPANYSKTPKSEDL